MVYYKCYNVWTKLRNYNGGTMQIKCFHLGAMQTNCYLVFENEVNKEGKKEAYLFDCAGKNLDSLYIFVEENNLELKHIVLTHGHGDHIEGLNDIIKKYPNAKVYIGKEDKEFLYDANLSLSHYIFGEKFKFEGNLTTVNEGDYIGKFKVIDTPGHTIGSKCFYYENSKNNEEKILISGDTLFRRSFGRYDLPTGNMNTLFSSLERLCKTLPEDTIVYSGHSEPTIIGEEKIFLEKMGVF